MAGFVPEPPPNVLVFTFKVVGIGDDMLTFRTWFSSHLWRCLEEKQRNYLGCIRVIHVFVRGQWVLGLPDGQYAVSVKLLGMGRCQGYSAN